MIGWVKTYKSLLIVKGFNQSKEIDFDEKISHEVVLKSIRILFAFAASNDYNI